MMMSSTAHDELAAAVREWLAAEDDWALGTGRGHPPEVERERVLDAILALPAPAPAPAPALDVAEVLPLVRAIADGYKHRFGLGPARLDGCTKVCIAMMREVESIAGQRLLRLALDTRCESVIGYHNHQCVKEQGHNGDCRYGGTRWSQARRQDKDPDTAGEGGDHE